MPFSKNTFDGWVTNLIRLLKPDTILDIGAGNGKYGVICRTVDPKIPVAAIEISEEYIKNYQLEKLYDTVNHMDVMDIFKIPRIRYELVIMGDVIEHLKKSDGIDLINFLIYRCGYLCIVYPEKYVQDDWDGRMQEAHISTWSVYDFVGFDTIHREHGGMQLFLLKGYQPSKMTITG